jgi:hypothetical protein
VRLRGIARRTRVDVDSTRMWVVPLQYAGEQTCVRMCMVVGTSGGAVTEAASVLIGVIRSEDTRVCVTMRDGEHTRIVNTCTCPLPAVVVVEVVVNIDIRVLTRVVHECLGWHERRHLPHQHAPVFRMVE